MVMLRVPYPMGFYAKGLDGRIDDPNGGWKGRGLWSSASMRHKVVDVTINPGEPVSGTGRNNNNVAGL